MDNEENGQPQEPQIPSEAFDTVKAAAATSPTAALDAALESLRAAKLYGRVFDALLMKKRLEMNLPLLAPNIGSILTEEQRRVYEDFVIDACRKTADMFLGSGDPAGAWPYLRTIGENELMRSALEKAVLDDGNSDALIGIAYHEGVHPVRGYEWILERHGTCNAVTVLEQEVRHPPEIRRLLAGKLVRRLHTDLAYSLKQEIVKRDATMPDTDDLSALIAGRDWLFEDNAYHIDASHLSAAVRHSVHMEDAADLRLARQLADYGKRLNQEWQYAGEPPFENVYVDVFAYLNALLGDGADEGVAHFRAKIQEVDEEGWNSIYAQTTVNLLHRMGRHAEAVDAFRDLKADADGNVRLCPSFLELCRLAGRHADWAEYSRSHGDLLGFTAALASGKV